MGLTWAGMERNLAIMFGSIPALRTLVTPITRLTSRTFSGSIFSSKKSQAESYDMGTGPRQTRKNTSELGSVGVGGERAFSGQTGTKFSETSTTTKSNTSQERILPTWNHGDRYREV